MISGLAQAYQVLGEKPILDLATNAADFIRQKLYDPASHALLRSYRTGPSAIQGCLDDYRYNETRNHGVALIGR